MTTKSPVVVAFDSSIGIAVGTKMDQNYIVVDLLLSYPQEHAVVHKNHLFYTSLTASDIRRITSFDEFQQTYPEYFI